MNFTLLPDIVSFLFLCRAFILLWKQRNQLQSFIPVMIAVAFLSIGRIMDIYVELSITHSSFLFGLKHESFDLIMTNAGDVCDALGILFLVFGFLKTIEFQKEERKVDSIFRELASALRMVQKYRPESGEWKPIEEYRHDIGALQ